MRHVFKLVFLFVGVVIGAGFATGSEIVLYFKNSGYLSVLLASCIMGVLSVIFCLFGRLQNKYKWTKNLLKIVVFLSSCVTYCVMLSGVGELIYTQFGIKYFGIFTSFVVSILMLYDMRLIKLLNLVIVPMIVVIMLIILIVSGGQIYVGLNLSSSLKYAGMNMLLGGYFMSEEGDTLSAKQIALTGCLVAIIMGLLMSICYTISMQATGSNMPVFEVARSFGLGSLAAVVVYLAIFTTLIGSGRAFSDMILKILPNKFVVFLLCFVLGFYFDGLDFGDVVAFSYGMIGEIGIVVCVFIVCILIVEMFRSMKNKIKIKNNKLKTLI